MFILPKYSCVSYPFYGRIPQWNAWWGSARTVLRTQSRRCSSRRITMKYDQVQPQLFYFYQVFGNFRLKDQVLNTVWDLSLFILQHNFSSNSKSSYWFSCCFFLSFIFYWVLLGLLRIEAQPQLSANHLESFLLGADVMMLIVRLHPDAGFLPDSCRFDGGHPLRFLLLCLKQAERGFVFCEAGKEPGRA